MDQKSGQGNMTVEERWPLVEQFDCILNGNCKKEMVNGSGNHLPT